MKDDIFDIVFIKQSSKDILIHFRNSVQLLQSFSQIKAVLRSIDAIGIITRSTNSAKAELNKLSETVEQLSCKINYTPQEDLIDLHKLTKPQRKQVMDYIKSNPKEYYE